MFYVWFFRIAAKCLCKIIKTKYFYFFISFLLFLPFGYGKTYAQQPHLEPSLFKEGLLELKFKDTWRYQQGDNLEWANPGYDDTKWYKIDPIGLKTYQMPDSLWPGYGWWRMTFTANPQIIHEIERLYFYTWGAADNIYLYRWKTCSYLRKFFNQQPRGKNLYAWLQRRQAFKNYP